MKAAGRLPYVIAGVKDLQLAVSAAVCAGDHTNPAMARGSECPHATFAV